MGQAVADTLSGEAAPRRWLRRGIYKRVLFVLVSLLLMGSAGGTTYISQYEPLRLASGYGVSGPTRRTISLGTRSVYIPRHEPGKVFTAYIPLRNEGPLAVTIESLFDEGGRAAADYPMTPERSLYARDEHHPQSLVPIDDGVRLEPGKAVTFGIEYVFGSYKYYDEGGSEVHGGTRITYSVLGVDKTVDLDFGFDIALRSRGAGGC